MLFVTRPDAGVFDQAGCAKSVGQPNDVTGRTEGFGDSSCSGSSRGDIADDFVLVEHAPDRRQESRELVGELGMVLGRLGKRDELFADQVVERTFRVEAALDPLGRSSTAPPRSSRNASGDYSD
jgi:hypothetical protein